MSAPRPESLRCISRVVIAPNATTGSGRTRGWQVRVIRRGISINEFFSDSSFGGRAGALSEAMHFRDGIVSELKPLPRSEIVRRAEPRTASGITGVRRTMKRTTRNGKVIEYPVWEANGSPEPNKRRVKCFSIPKLGEDAARERAIAQRLRWEELMERNERKRGLVGAA